MICSSDSHLYPRLPDEAFKCPACGAGAGEFYIDELHHGECELLDKSEVLVCTNCGYEETAEAFIDRYLHNSGIKVCPYCGGCGVLTRSSK